MGADVSFAISHRARVQRDHHERPVQPFEIRQPHAELIGRSVLGGIEHGELGLVLLERGRYPERRLTAAEQSAGDVTGHDQRRHGAGQDEQQVAPNLAHRVRPEFRRAAATASGATATRLGLNGGFVTTGTPGQIGGHRPRPAQQRAQRRLAQDDQQGEAGGDPHPDRVLRAAEQVATGNRHHQQQPGCQVHGQESPSPTDLTTLQPADDQHRGEGEERADQTENECLAVNSSTMATTRQTFRPVTDQQIDDLGLIRTGESRPRADAESPVRLIRLARLGSIHGEGKVIGGPG